MIKELLQKNEIIYKQFENEIKIYRRSRNRYGIYVFVLHN
jgi:hypothetical protein